MLRDQHNPIKILEYRSMNCDTDHIVANLNLEEIINNYKYLKPFNCGQISSLSFFKC